VVLFVGHSKANQERHGADVGIEAMPDSPLCAVTALRRWLDVRGNAPGSLFCHPDRGGNLADRPGHDRPAAGTADGLA
jgi:hypothetical protein